MARTVASAALGSRTARDKLKAGRRYWAAISEGLHVGYRRGKHGGKWTVRLYRGDRNYRLATLPGVADDVMDGNGESVLTFGDAQRRAHALHLEHTFKAAGKPVPGTVLTVGQVLDDYVEFLNGHRRTGRDGRYRAALIKSTLGGDVPIEKLTTKMIEDWLHKLAESQPLVRGPASQQSYLHRDLADPEVQRRRRASANRTYTVLRAALRRAWKAGRIPSDSAWARVQAFRGVDAARVRWLNENEGARLVTAAEPSFAKLVSAALLCGARLGELAELRVADFSPAAAALHIRRSKSGKSRHIPLTNEGVVFFASICSGRGADDFMLLRADGSPWIRGSTNKPMAKACVRAGIKPLGIHAMRHSFASICVAKGMPLMVVARLLGHADTSLVEHVYGHLAPSFISESVKQFGPRFGFARPNVRPIRPTRRPA